MECVTVHMQRSAGGTPSPYPAVAAAYTTSVPASNNNTASLVTPLPHWDHNVAFLYLERQMAEPPPPPPPPPKKKEKKEKKKKEEAGNNTEMHNIKRKLKPKI